MLNIARTLFRRSLVAVTLLAAATLALADDTDIFTGGNVGGMQNVLLMLDNTANWSASIGNNVPDCSYADGTGGPKPDSPGKEQGTKFGIEKCALYNVILRLPASDTNPYFNIGFMLFNTTTSGYPRSRFLPLNTANKATLLNLVRNLSDADKVNNGTLGEAFYEAFLMLTNASPYLGTTDPKRDPGAFANGRYTGANSTACNNHIIYLANGSPQDPSASTDTAIKLLAAAGGDTTSISYPSGYLSNSDAAKVADEWARFLNKRADISPTLLGVQSVRVHTIAVTGGNNEQEYINYMREIAQQGGGESYAASNVDELTRALLAIFNGMQAIDSVFVSAALPLSTNAQGTYENQVFIGMFRPDLDGRPRWNGNLKQYRFAYDAATKRLTLVDSAGNEATSSTTGFLRPNVTSYWTSDSSFWVNSPLKLGGGDPSASDAPDGPEVERGGVAQRLRTSHATSQSGRVVLTCLDCAAGTALTGTDQATRFVVGNNGISRSALNAADNTERDAIIEWARGADNVSGGKGVEVPGPGGTTTVRPSIHGDVLHSRPVVVNYGGTIGAVAFYGSNDGTLRAVYGSQTDTNGGSELWAFIPSEHFGRLKRLRDGSPEIRLPGTPAEVNAAPRDYTVDGPISVYRNPAANRTWLFVTMRRGGRALYAFDVSDPTAPRFMWKRTNASGGEFANLGQTWSAARVAMVKERGVNSPVLVMGGGYDTVEDAIPVGSTTAGNRVFVIDAETGSLLKTFSTNRSVPADVSLLDVDADGFADRAYVVDIAANVYRIDFETSTAGLAPSSWVMTQIARLGDNANTRKVFFGADVVPTKSFIALMFGTGDREKPLMTTSDDAFFVIKDRKVSKGAPGSVALIEQSSLELQAKCASSDPESCTTGNNAAATADPDGCYVTFSSGERVVNGATTIAGNTFFGTNTPTPPAANTCNSNLGIARTYTMPLFCEPARSIVVTGGGLLPTAIAGYVNMPGTPPTRVPFVIGVGDNRIQPTVPLLSQPQVRRRSFWFQENQGR